MPKYNHRAWQQEIVKRIHHPRLLDEGEGLARMFKGSVLKQNRQALETKLANSPANKSLKKTLNKIKVEERHLKENRKK